MYESQYVSHSLITARKVCEGYVIIGVYLSTGEGVRGEGEGVHGEQGCVVKGCMCGEGGHAWQRGACVAKGGMCGKGGHVWQRGRGAWQKGVCMAKGEACMIKGDMCGKGGMRGKGGHAWQMGGMCGIRDTEIRSMSGRYASYWNAFLLVCIVGH